MIARTDATPALRYALWIMAFSAISVFGQQLRPVAHVLEVRGTWHVLGHKSALNAGEALSAGSELTTQWYDYDSSITIVRDSDLSRQRVACLNAPSNPCRNSVTIRADETESETVKIPDELKNLFTAAIVLLQDKPPALASHYAVTLSRGQHTVTEYEDLLSFNSPQDVSLSNVLPGFPAGNYRADIVTSNSATRAIRQNVIVTSDGVWRGIRIRRPGLYSISIKNSSNEDLAALMLLLSPQSHYRAQRRLFEAANVYSAAWNGPESRDDQHLFLRATLMLLSRAYER